MRGTGWPSMAATCSRGATAVGHRHRMPPGEAGNALPKGGFEDGPGMIATNGPHKDLKGTLRSSPNKGTHRRSHDLGDKTVVGRSVEHPARRRFQEHEDRRSSTVARWQAAGP